MLTAKELAYALSRFDTDKDIARVIEIINDLEKDYNWHYVPPYQFPPCPCVPQTPFIWSSTTANTVGSTIINGCDVAWSPEQSVTYTCT